MLKMIFLIAIITGFINFAAIRFNYKTVAQYAMTLQWTAIVLLFFGMAYEAGKVAGAYEETKKQDAFCEVRLELNDMKCVDRIIKIKEYYEDRNP